MTLKLAVKTVKFDGDEVYLVKVLEQDDREINFCAENFEITHSDTPSIDIDDEENDRFYARGDDEDGDHSVCCTTNKAYIKKLKKTVRALNKENSSTDEDLDYEVFE